MKLAPAVFLLGIMLTFVLSGCSTDPVLGPWEYTIAIEQEELKGTLTLSKTNSTYSGVFTSFENGTIELQNLSIENNVLNASFPMWGEEVKMTGEFQGETFHGKIMVDQKEFAMMASRPIEPSQAYIPPDVPYIFLMMM